MLLYFPPAQSNVILMNSPKGEGSQVLLKFLVMKVGQKEFF